MKKEVGKKSFTIMPVIIPSSEEDLENRVNSTKVRLWHFALKKPEIGEVRELTNESSDVYEYTLDIMNKALKNAFVNVQRHTGTIPEKKMGKVESHYHFSVSDRINYHLEYQAIPGSLLKGATNEASELIEDNEKDMEIISLSKKLDEDFSKSNENTKVYLNSFSSILSEINTIKEGS